MDIRTRRKTVGILRVLHEAGRPLGATRIARELRPSGIDLSHRTVRHYLGIMDRSGLTRSCGKRGREITPAGEEELRSALVMDKVGFVAARVDSLTYRMTFSLPKRRGKVILNVSTVDEDALPEAAARMMEVYHAGLGMGRFVVLGRAGDTVGDFVVPAGRVAIGTICSVTINGALLSAGIAVSSRFGGLLEVERGMPVRFTQVIHYDGTTLDPLEIFIRGRMTSVRAAAAGGRGLVGASFREVPAAALADVQKISRRLDRIGLGGIMVVGRPNQPLLDIPVPQERAGIIIVGGLNPLAAVEEAGIRTENAAMHSMFGFEGLQPLEALEELAAAPGAVCALPATAERLLT